MFFKILFRRLILSIPTLIGVSLLAFLLIRLAPGDPVQLMLGERGGDPEVYQKMKFQLGLDQPLPVQYVQFLGRALRGDLGTSFVSQKSVVEEFLDRFPATMELGLIAILISVVVGIPLGVVAAVQRGRLCDSLLMSSALVGYSMPIFWWGLMLILIFSIGLGVTPVSGRMGFEFDFDSLTGFMLIDSWFSESPWRAFKSALSHLVLPSVVLATIPLAVIARMTRSSLLDVLKEDYVRTAVAKGLPRRRVVLSHALRNALIPIVTVVGLMLGSILTGAILTESIFAWPGLGKWIVSSVEARDYPVIQGGLILISATVVLVNILVDLAYLVVNPMMRGP